MFSVFTYTYKKPLHILSSNKDVHVCRANLARDYQPWPLEKGGLYPAVGHICMLTKKGVARAQKRILL